jgi:S-disulfanyl-L-cysteine oxidoreductase SoxD
MNVSRLIAFVLFLLASGYRETSSDSSDGANRPGRNPPPFSKDTIGWPATFGFGRTATQKEIDAWDISIRPDGKGLPAGSGNAATGSAIYQVKCAACHGKTGMEGPYARLVAPMDDTTKTKAIGNYWPYATTLFDYTRRAMPYNAPGSLSADEVYSITAFLLHVNKIIDSNTVITAESLPKVIMPARTLFVPDDRKGGPEIR